MAWGARKAGVRDWAGPDKGVRPRAKALCSGGRIWSVGLEFEP